jgi:hypothetical protein
MWTSLRPDRTGVLTVRKGALVIVRVEHPSLALCYFRANSEKGFELLPL